MKIIILDGYTSNPGDLSWADLEKLCELKVYDKTNASEVIERAKDADGILINKVIISEEVLAKLPKLKYIGVLATGYNVVDTEVCKKRGICVTNIPSYSSESVAQLVFAFIFNFYWHITEHSSEVFAGKWTKSEHFCYHSFPLFEASYKTLGIIGFGNIGQAVAKIALSMNMKVIYFNRSKKSVQGLEAARQVEINELLKESDIISLNCPLTDKTKNIIDEAALNSVKPSAYIINTGRGPLVDEAAVANALKAKKIAGFAADVLSTEPPSKDNPLLSASNCLITPHIAWQTLEARSRLLQIATENVKAFIDGKPINTV